MQYKDQWVKLAEAPSTTLISAQGPLMGTKIGLGGIIANDRVGVHSVSNISAAGSYALSIDRKTTLNFGLQAGLVIQKSDYSSLTADLLDPQDALFYENDYRAVYPQYGTGIYLYSDSYYFGLSVPNINFAKSPNGVDDELTFTKVHYFINGGYLFTLDRTVKLQPGFLIKHIQGYQWQYDLNANFIFMDALFLGASYRSNSTLGLLVQMQVTDQLRFGYSYDTPIGQNTPIASPSHELMLSYLFTFKKRRVINPRYF
jgi:type IX secretion system PorP/SprF family membrane protein